MSKSKKKVVVKKPAVAAKSAPATAKKIEKLGKAVAGALVGKAITGVKVHTAAAKPVVITKQALQKEVNKVQKSKPSSKPANVIKQAVKNQLTKKMAPSVKVIKVEKKAGEKTPTRVVTAPAKVVKVAALKPVAKSLVAPAPKAASASLPPLKPKAVVKLPTAGAIAQQAVSFKPRAEVASSGSQSTPNWGSNSSSKPQEKVSLSAVARAAQQPQQRPGMPTVTFKTRN